jgi:hypothetical protein
VICTCRLSARTVAVFAVILGLTQSEQPGFCKNVFVRFASTASRFSARSLDHDVHEFCPMTSWGIQVERDDKIMRTRIEIRLDAPTTD